MKHFASWLMCGAFLVLAPAAHAAQTVYESELLKRGYKQSRRYPYDKIPRENGWILQKGKQRYHCFMDGFFPSQATNYCKVVQ